MNLIIATLRGGYEIWQTHLHMHAFSRRRCKKRSLGRSYVVHQTKTVAEKHIDFPPPVGRDTKVSLTAAILCTASCCSFLSVTLSFCMSDLTHIQSCQPSPQ